MAPPLTIAYLGNFSVPWTTEEHVALSLEDLGHDVIRIQEGGVHPLEVPSALQARSDLFLWTQTYGLAEKGGTREERERMVEMIKAMNVPTVGFHLDRWWGLDREDQIAREPFFRLDWLFTADGGHDDEWGSLGMRHVWSPPAVYAGEAVKGTPRAEYASNLAFVGNHSGGYHSEWTHRRDLIRHLRRRYNRAAKLYPRPGRRPIRGAALSDLYASVKIVVGDSCLAGGITRYHSDRIPETLGRGGFLLHPYVEGIEELYKDGEHLRLWPLGDWKEFDRLVAYYLAHADERRAIADAGQRHVQENHTYRHRLEVVLDTVLRSFPGWIREGTTDAEVVEEIWRDDVYRCAAEVRRGSVVVDLGANVGIFSVWAAKRGARVFAVEPFDENIEQLYRNVRGAGVAESVDLYRVAVGDRPGRVRVNPGKGEARSGGAWTEPGSDVEQVTLGEIIRWAGGEVDVLKLDVEGAEFDAFEGATLEDLRAVRFFSIEFHGEVLTNRPIPAGSFGRLVSKLGETHQLDFIGKPSRGGYIYAHRLDDA